MGIAINDLVYLLGEVIQLELTSESKDLFIGSFKVKAIRKDGKEIILSGTDDEGLNREIPIKWITDYLFIN